MIKKNFPLMVLRHLSHVPGSVANLGAGRIATVELAKFVFDGKPKGEISFIAQTEPTLENPDPTYLASIGILGAIEDPKWREDGACFFKACFGRRMRVLNIIQDKPFFIADVEELYDRELTVGEFSKEVDAALPTILDVYNQRRKRMGLPMHSMETLSIEMPLIDKYFFGKELDPAWVFISGVIERLELSEQKLISSLMCTDDPIDRVRYLRKYLESLPIIPTRGPMALAGLIEDFSKNNLNYSGVDSLPVDDESTFAALRSALCESDNWRLSVAMTGAISRTTVNLMEAVVVLRSLLTHTESGVRFAALEGLEKIGVKSAQALPEVLTIITTDQDISVVEKGISLLATIGVKNGEAAAFLARIIECASSSSMDRDVYLAMGMAISVARPPNDRVRNEWERELFIDDHAVIVAAARASGGFTDFGRLIVPALSKGLSIKNAQISVAIAQSLTCFSGAGRDVIRSWLEERIRNSEGLRDHKEIVEIYLTKAERPFEDALHLFKLCVCEDRDLSADRALIISCLVSKNEKVSELQGFVGYLNSEDSNLRSEVLYLLEHVCWDSDRFVDKLIPLLDDKSTDIPTRAAWILGRAKLNSEIAKAALQKIWNDPSRPMDLRLVARDALTNLGVKIEVPEDGFGALENLWHEIALPEPLVFSNPVRESRAIHPSGGTLNLGLHNVYYHNGKIFYLWHKVLEKATDGEWLTNKDKFGIGCVDCTLGTQTTFKLPLLFPSQKTGGAEAKREWRLMTVSGSKIIVRLKIPYCRSKAWGNDNFVYSFDMKTGHFERILPSSKGIYETKLLDDIERLEHPDYRFCDGELKIWSDNDGALVFSRDSTAFHSEHSSVSDEMQNLLENAYQAEKRLYESQPYLIVFDDSLFRLVLSTLDRQNKIVVYDLYALCSGDSQRLLGGRLRDPRVVEALKVSVQEQDYLAIFLRGFEIRESGGSEESCVLEIIQV